MFCSICLNQAYSRQTCPVFSKLLQNVPNKLPMNDSLLHVLYNSSFKSPFNFTLLELRSCNTNRLCLPKNFSIVIWRLCARCHQFVLILGPCLGYVTGVGWRMGKEIFSAQCFLTPFYTCVLITQNF
jgi:hypothetical protein